MLFFLSLKSSKFNNRCICKSGRINNGNNGNFFSQSILIKFIEDGERGNRFDPVKGNSERVEPWRETL